MRERTVHITRGCNLACPTCDHRGRLQPTAEAVRGALRIASAGRPETIFLRGGEPLLLRDLPDLVRLARSEGAGRVVVDTNALLASDTRVLQPVVDAGLAGARVFLPAGDDGGWEAFVGVAGGLVRVRLGIANLRAAGVSVALRHPVERATIGALPGVIAFAASFEGPTLPVLLDVRDGGRLPADVAALAERAGVTLAVLPGAAGTIPADLPVLSFPGAESARPARVREQPVPSDDVFSVLYEEDDGRTDTARVALTWRCDQRCAMCDLAAVAGAPSDQALSLAVEAAAERGVRRLVLTGGEPTLDPRLPDVIRHARRAGIRLVELQTNAVRLGEGDRAAALAAAGLGRAFVSLHAADATTSDGLTGAPGTHARTLAGIDALLASGVEVDLNCVISRANLSDLGALVDLVHARWAAHARFGRVHFHTVRADPNAGDLMAERWRDIVPPLSALGSPLRAALDRCLAVGVPFTGPSSAMGVPWCVLDGDPRYLGALEGPAASRPHRAERPLFARAPACDGCRLVDRCPGVRRDYLALHGTDGLRTLR